MTKKVRKNYTAEFKREAIRLVTDEGYKIAEAARSLDINANMLGRWVHEAREGSDSAFRGKGNLMYVLLQTGGYLPLLHSRLKIPLS